MLVTARASTYSLSGRGRAMLEEVLDAECSMVRRDCGKRDFGGRVCALAFIYAADVPLLPVTTYHYALTEARRDAVIADDAGAGAELVWSPPEWDFENFLEGTPDENYPRAQQLADDLQRAGCEDPEGAFLQDLACVLARVDWSQTMDVTADFACWATEHEWASDTAAEFSAVNMRATVQSYERRGWLAWMRNTQRL
jgi:hypothetical protein